MQAPAAREVSVLCASSSIPLLFIVAAGTSEMDRQRLSSPRRSFAAQSSPGVVTMSMHFVAIFIPAAWRLAGYHRPAANLGHKAGHPVDVGVIVGELVLVGWTGWQRC